MRHTPFFRLLAALFGVWFTFTLVQPNGMTGMAMSGTGAVMDMSPETDVAAPNPSILSMDMSDADMSADHAAAMHATSSVELVGERGGGDRPSAPVECDQHDCCCSALSPISLMPSATLAWLPEHVINQETPKSGDCVVHTDGQLLLPFANGPPRTVTA